MIILRFVLIFWGTVFVSWGEGGGLLMGAMETWTDAQGRTLQGRLWRVKGTVIQMILPDGVLCPIPLEKFAVPDQRRLLERMVGHPAALEYSFSLTGNRHEDGSWQVLVLNSGGNTLEDLQWTGRFIGGGPPRKVGPARALGRLEPGQQQGITLRPGFEGSAGATGLQLRLVRKNAIVWEWHTPGQTAPDWPLETGQVRVPALGLPTAQVLAELARVGSGSGQLALPFPVPAVEKNPMAAVPEGEDLVRLFESP